MSFFYLSLGRITVRLPQLPSWYILLEKLIAKPFANDFVEN